MMHTFSARWLRMREPFDHAARDTRLVTSLVSSLPSVRPLRVAELGAGLGSGLRYLAPRLGGAQHWTLVDHDRGLLDAALAIGAPDGVIVDTLEFDLRKALPDLDVDLVSTQALLDLVSASWLSDFGRWLAKAQLPVLAALTVDGRVDWGPVDPFDAVVQRCFRAHQLTDRGFGPSRGPQAAGALAVGLSQAGYKVSLARADWEIGPDAPQMLTEMLQGMAQAATEAAAGVTTAQEIAQWVHRRTLGIAAGEVSLRVGHLDLLGLPAG